MILGVFLRVISWPMGFLFVAKGKSNVHFLTQLFFNVAHVSLIVLLIPVLGIIGAGMAFFLLYVVHVLVMKFLVHREDGFTWTRANKSDFALLSSVFAGSFVILHFMPKWTGAVTICCVALLAGFYSLRRMMTIFGISSYKETIRIVKKKAVFNASK
jgi:PST family polysaccharide transporter